jgi:hypothetical protein
LQAPQLSTSLLVFTQALLQLVVPAPHDTVHAPPEQSGVVAAQTVPHIPQFSGSVWVGVQTPPHRSPWLGHAHWPFTHCVPPVQRVPQRPQFVLSMVESTHPAGHAKRVPGQTHVPPLHD